VSKFSKRREQRQKWARWETAKTCYLGIAEPYSMRSERAPSRKRQEFDV